MSMPLLDDSESGEVKTMLIAREKVKTLAEGAWTPEPDPCNPH